MRDITIDVQVLMIKFGLSDPEMSKRYYKETNDLTDLLEESGSDFFLALDDKDKIEGQYFKKLGQDYGRWGMMLAEKDKIVTVPYESLKHSNRRIFTKLQRANFTSNKGEDLKYVETANKTDCHIVVTYDPHFYDNAKKLKKLPVHVRTCRDCTELSG